MTKELETKFEGTGEVKGYFFVQIEKSEHAYIYRVSHPLVARCHYEVFERKKSPVCIDFEKRIYSETDFKESYPKAKDFGVWAFTFNSYESAKGSFEVLNQTKP